MGWRKKEASKLADKRFLVVGAGGIGCELLKSAVLSGFKKIHVIDLDTIDVSNLNRQFLFRREHVGKSKAEVASQAVKNFQPDVEIEFDHASIFDEKFGLAFFQQFSLVMNALDNKAARTHVNRMCLASRIPLVESGSAGYLGQVTTIVRDQTECYECVEKPAQQKSYPGCTIRNTPSEHIHCTVWAKHVFNQLFGEVDIDDDVSPDFNDEENKDSGSSENMDQGEEKPEENGEKAATPDNTRTWAEKVSYNSELIFNKLFSEDIHYLLKMKNLWKERRKPIPKVMQDVLEQGSSTCSSVTSFIDDINKVWSLPQCASVFDACMNSLRNRKEQLANAEVLYWDKDDEDAMRFVAACANIRASIFGIPTKTLFEIKSMAGNIIPAIATTNAMVAGMVVCEALKIVHGRMDKLRNYFIKQTPNPRGQILVEDIPGKPKEGCIGCADKRECFVRVNMSEMTVRALQDKVLKGHLHMVAPDVVDSATSRIIISSEAGETESLEGKTLAELGIGDILECDDFVQKLDLTILLFNSHTMKGDEFEITRDSGEPKKEAPLADVAMEAEITEEPASRKRKDAAIEDEVDAKRKKIAEEIEVK